MDNKQLGEFIKSLDADFEIKEGKQFTEVTVPPAKLHSLASQLREKEETLFDFLVSITGVDYVPDLGLIYHLRSTKHGHMVVIKSRTSDRENPQFDSVSDIWEAADLHEREAFDLLGTRFVNHPDLRRLFLNSSWGFPLRKDYVDDDIITW
ncbi:MAG TPA: NADH-quinone oxidoreductase chain 5 [Bacteroidales bacterium]|jgi:NADH-quinone oxidoreductase subunit C|nr:NADH-quinone oxidoreductase chain 5 [Bacteroidales bacterium]HBZ20214.1 NADH-quinone oxidoreductase chain 5 [Bacteroidales bacterium]